MKESEGIMPMTSTYSGVVLQQKVKGFFYSCVVIYQFHQWDYNTNIIIT